MAKPKAGIPNTLEVVIKADEVFIRNKGTNQWLELTREQAVSLAKQIILKLMP